MRQPKWDQYEVALLVDAYIRITSQGINKKEVLQELSCKLRTKAKNEGIEIDDTFRNLNGMMWQIGFIECAFMNTGYGKHMPSKLFQNIVNLYKNDRDTFNIILNDANKKTIELDVTNCAEEIGFSMVVDRCNFKKWLMNREEFQNKVDVICNAIDVASSYANGHRISKKSIWNLDSVFEATVYFERLSKDRIFNVVHKNEAKIVSKISNTYIEYLTKQLDRNDCSNGEKNVVKNDIVSAVAEKYVYGYRLGSLIERMKLRDFLSERNIVFDGNDEELEALLVENGFVSNGKVFIESGDKQEKVDEKINSLFDEGISVIYYESFFEANNQLMMDVHIASPDALKDKLKEKRKDLLYSKNFFTNLEKLTEDAAVAQEILRVWNTNVVSTVDELAEKLPYVPYEKVKFYLSLNNQFVWVSEGVYTRVDTIKISDDEKREIERFVDIEIARKGYVSLSELPLTGIIEENYELSEYAILFGVFNKILSGKYSINGRIVTRDGEDFDSTILMKQYCVEQDEITLDGAIMKVEEFTGVADRRIAYPILYDVLVRVNEQLFVSQDKVDFEIDKIDEVINRLAKDGYIAVKEITSFALFPECGYPWNHYLLESFCYRFSQKFSYRTNLFNGRNAGAVVEKTNSWDYIELMSHAVARANIQLNEKEIGNFLFEAGYMARSKFGGIKEIAEQAKNIREEAK